MPTPVPAPTALPPLEVAPRLGRLRAAMEVAGVDAVVVTKLVNVRYLSGFTGSAAVLAVTGSEARLVTDGRYAEQAPRQVAAVGADIEVEITSDAQRMVLAAVVQDAARIGLESDAVTWSELRRFEQWFTRGELVPTEGLVEGLRIVKDAGEVARMEAAAAIADAALAEVRHRLAEQPTEQELGLELDSAMRRLGASGSSFETIVASGPNGALPHARPSERRITEGDLVVLDFGAVVDGYCSDMTRTLGVGELDDVRRRMYQVVLAAQQAGVDAVRAGAAARDVDAACRSVIADAGWADAFVHGTGHGVGLEIHEAPRVGTTADATLTAGNVVTVEPGVYLPEHGGVRIEDTVVVTSDGCRCLTRSPKDPAV